MQRATKQTQRELCFKKKLGSSWWRFKTGDLFSFAPSPFHLLLILISHVSASYKSSDAPVSRTVTHNWVICVNMIYFQADLCSSAEHTHRWHLPGFKAALKYFSVPFFDLKVQLSPLVALCAEIPSRKSNYDRPELIISSTIFCGELLTD